MCDNHVMIPLCHMKDSAQGRRPRMASRTEKQSGLLLCRQNDVLTVMNTPSQRDIMYVFQM